MENNANKIVKFDTNKTDEHMMRNSNIMDPSGQIVDAPIIMISDDVKQPE